MTERSLNPILLGAVGGLAWAASLRGFMTEVAGSESQVSWTDTFVGILLPGLVAGGLLGWAELRRRESRPVRALTAAPLLFAVATLSLPGQLMAFVTTGIGGGAVAVPLMGIMGGYVLAGRHRWARIACSALAISLLALAAVFTVVLGIPLTARTTWVAVLILTLLVVQAWACAIPLRAAPAASGRASRSLSTDAAPLLGR